MGSESNDGGGLCFADGLLDSSLSAEAQAFIVRVNETDWDRFLPELRSRLDDADTDVPSSGPVHDVLAEYNAATLDSVRTPDLPGDATK